MYIKTDTKVNFDKIKELREKIGKSLSEASNELRVTPGTLNNIEKGIRVPSVELLFNIANYYGVDVNDLIIAEKNKGS